MENEEWGLKGDMNDGTVNEAQSVAGNVEGRLLAGRYRIVKQLGQGGMGAVWLVEDVQLDNRQFAVKMLPSILVSNKRAYRQLRGEALLAMRLDHPNIVQMCAFEENDGNPFLVMDYVDGQTLDDYLADHTGTTGVLPVPGGLPEADVLRILRPIAAALDYAHAKGVVHRDVKPGNVMIAKDGTPYILDFGIAREIQETMTRVTGRHASGTLLYMSPEQLNGARPKPAQDVYSFAAMVYECLKGEPPFARGQIEHQILNNPPDPLPGGPRSCAAAVMAGLAKNPEDRPASCTAVLEGSGFSRVEHVERVEVNGGRSDAPLPPQGGSRVPRPSRGCLWKALLSVTALALLGAGGWWFYQYGYGKSNYWKKGRSRSAKSERRSDERSRADKESRRRDEDAATVRTAYKLFASGDYDKLLQGPETKDSTLPDVQYLQGRVLSYGLTGSHDLARAIQMYEAAAKDGHALATVDLGTFYCAGWGVKKDMARGLELVEKGKKEVERLADEGNPYAQELLGDLHSVGWGYATNKIVAAKWHKQAADQGDVIGMTSYGSCLLEGNGVETNDVVAIDLLEKAYSRGDSSAALALGDFWIEKDRSKAELWYGRCRQGILSAAEQGVPHYQYRVGTFYAEGLWGETNMQESVRWFSKAAEEGHMLAQNVLGILYWEGMGVEQNHSTAVKWFREAADQGCASAEVNLGKAYKTGVGVEKNIDEALRWLNKAAEQGDMEAQFKIGEIYMVGADVRQDPGMGVKWLRKAAEQGHAEAQNLLGIAYVSGLGVEKNHEEAIRWYTKAAEQGHVSAKYNLGQLYFGRKEYLNAMTWFRKAADQGKADAQNMIGCLYFRGLGVGQDYTEALKWCRKAAEQNLPVAQYNLGEMYWDGTGVDRDYGTAVAWYRKAADQKHASAQDRLGLAYGKGLGVKQDFDEAIRWHAKAAEQGLVGAQYNLGCLYLNRKDYQNAVTWLRKAADQKEAEAQNMMGRAYYEGWGVDKDYAEAVRWYTKAAEQNFPVAQYNLGLMYLAGEGVDQDKGTAVAWFRKAAAQGSAKAKEKLKELGY